MQSFTDRFDPVGVRSPLIVDLQVLVVYDNQYHGRFWPCIECWSSFQVATPEGLVGAVSDRSQRTSYVCVGGSTGTEKEARSFLERQWRHVSIQEALDRLLSPDLLVTNQKDKEVQAKVLAALNQQTVEFVADFWSRKVSELQGDDAVPEESFVGPLGDFVPQDFLAAVDSTYRSQGCVSNTFTDMVASIYRSHPLVSSYTREEFKSCLAYFLSCTAEWDMVTVSNLFPVYTEILKIDLSSSISRSSVCAFPDGSLVVSASSDVVIFSSDGVERSNFSSGGTVTCVCVLPDGNLVTGCKDGARILSSRGNEIKRLCEGEEVTCVAAFGDGHLAIACNKGLFLFDSDGNKTRIWLQGGVFCMALIPPNLTIRGRSGRLAFIGGSFGACVLHHNGPVLEVVLELPRDDSVCGLCVFPDGRLATSDAGCTCVFDSDGDLLWETPYGESSGFSMCVLPNGNLFHGGDGGAYILTGSLLFLLQLSDDDVESSCVVPNGNLCVCYRRVARVYKLAPWY